MRICAGLLAIAAVTWSLATITADGQAPGPKPPADYVGSSACARCHDVEYGQWQRSLHIRMTKPIAEALVAGDFTPGARFADHGRTYEFGRSGGRPFVSIAYGDRAAERFAVDYTLGAKRYQGYLSTQPDGRIVVLPVFWHVESRRWIDWKEITPIPDGAHDIRQVWNTNCFNCHGTNIVQGFDVAASRFNTTWTEMGIGCEACHGPGREHAALMDEWEKDPASKPAYDNSSKNRRLSDTLKIFSTRSVEPRRVFDTCAYCHGNKRNMFVGFRGGDRYEDYALPFMVSDAIPANDPQGEFWPDGRPNRFNRPQALMLSGCFQAGAVACTNCHVAHGSRNEFSLKVNINQGRNGDALCTQCHAETRREPGAGRREPGAPGPTSQASGATPQAPSPTPQASAGPQARKPASPFIGASLSRHTFHAPDSAGSRCINCHMSDVNWRLLMRRRDHTFRPPVPEMTAAFGVPNACTTCHDERTPEWAAKQMDEWWGDGARRKAATRVAEVMYRAGSGDQSVAPDLARIAVDRSLGAPLRASAADYLGQIAFGRAGTVGLALQSQTAFASGDPKGSPPPRASGATGGGNPSGLPGSPPGGGNPSGLPVLPPAVVNTLIGAASDPEAIVRAAAVEALAAGDRARVLTPILARLVDSTRVVRVRAAEVLLGFGIVSLPDTAGEALARAQDEYAASLRAFPDLAVNHAALGWLEAQRGRLAEAERALQDAIAVEPRYARPWVIKGVIAARANRFGDAVGFWKKARALEPSFPNLNQLIAEGEKRKKTP